MQGQIFKSSANSVYLCTSQNLSQSSKLLENHCLKEEENITYIVSFVDSWLPKTIGISYRIIELYRSLVVYIGDAIDLTSYLSNIKCSFCCFLHPVMIKKAIISGRKSITWQKFRILCDVLGEY